jgi:predicted TIM-barrel fold metal-dependent hydrolase
MYRIDGPLELRPVGETEFAESVAREAATRAAEPLICAANVGFADLTLGAEVGDVLDAHIAASPRFRGIRHCTAWDASELIHKTHTNPTPQMMSSASFRAGFRELARRDLSFDAWVFHPQIGEVADLARAYPNTRIVLDHLGGPLGVGPYSGRRDEVFALWRQSIRGLSECDNVLVKLGGLLMPLNGWRLHKRATPVGSEEVASLCRDYHLHAIDCFGVDRCMFESNFPADKPSVSYTVLWNAFKRMTKGFSEAERHALFHDTAARCYRLHTGSETNR